MDEPIFPERSHNAVITNVMMFGQNLWEEKLSIELQLGQLPVCRITSSLHVQLKRIKRMKKCDCRLRGSWLRLWAVKVMSGFANLWIIGPSRGGLDKTSWSPLGQGHVQSLVKISHTIAGICPHFHCQVHLSVMDKLSIVLSKIWDTNFVWIGLLSLCSKFNGWSFCSNSKWPTSCLRNHKFLTWLTFKPSRKSTETRIVICVSWMNRPTHNQSEADIFLSHGLRFNLDDPETKFVGEEEEKKMFLFRKKSGKKQKTNPH